MSVPSDVINRSIIAQTDSDLWSVQKVEQDLMVLQKSAFKYLDFLGKYTNVVKSTAHLLQGGIVKKSV